MTTFKSSTEDFILKNKGNRSIFLNIFELICLPTAHVRVQKVRKFSKVAVRQQNKTFMFNIIVSDTVSCAISYSFYNINTENSQFKLDKLTKEI